jgi:predicted DNA-binding transcriptional regulator AlpA
MRNASIQTSQPAEYIDAPTFCAMVGIKTQTAAKWRCTGEGPRFTRVGSAVRYKRSAVEQWLASRTGTSTSAIERALA